MLSFYFLHGTISVNISRRRSKGGIHQSKSMHFSLIISILGTSSINFHCDFCEVPIDQLCDETPYRRTTSHYITLKRTGFQTHFNDGLQNRLHKIESLRLVNTFNKFILSRQYSMHHSLLSFFICYSDIYAIYTYKFQKSIILNLHRNNWQSNKSFYRVYVSLFACDSV